MLNFNNSLFQVAAFAALGLLTLENLGVEASSSRRDRRDYPDIYEAMRDLGDDLFWRSYDLTTADGYELTMFRLTGLRKRKTVPNQWIHAPILLLHGLTSDAYTWFDNSRGDTNDVVLPAKLFKDGHDVWLGNIRGTQYTLSHTSLDAYRQDAKFFDYDNVDISVNDVPAMIKKIV